MIYTAWWSASSQSVTLVAGENQPRFANGVLQEPDNVLLYRIEAGSHNEAMAEHHRRQGWEPYKPMAEEV